MKKHAALLGAVLLGLASLLAYAQAPLANRSSGFAAPRNSSSESRASFGSLHAQRQSPILNQLAELTASDGYAGDNLGSGVAIDGNTAVAGALMWGRKGSGVAYVFVEPSTGWTNMTQTAKLTASDGSRLGLVGISGTTVVATGASGKAYVFVEPATGWADMTETARLAAPNGDSLSGVAISGNTVVAVAGSGAAYVFVEPAHGWAGMTEPAKLTTSNGDALTNVAISGSTVAAGAVEGNNGNGAAYVFVEPAGGWTDMTETAELTASDGASDDFLGDGIGISGDTVVAGAPNHMVNDNGWQGALYVFVKPAGGWANMTQTAELTASDGASSDQLGNSAAISGNTVVGGAPQYEPWDPGNGKAYAFFEPDGGWTDMTESEELVASGGGPCDALGVIVAVSGGTAVAGAPGVCAGGEASGKPGAAYVFSACPSTSGVALCPSSLTFETQLIGASSSPQQVTLTNTSNETLDFTRITVSANFSQTNNCPSNLAPSAQCTANVVFTPHNVNTINGTLAVYDNAPNSPQTVSLTGVGTAVTLLPSSLNFGDQPVGTTSQPQIVTLTNYAPKAATIYGTTFTGNNPHLFAVQSTTCGKSLPAGGSCTAGITFTPKSTGPKSATFNVNDNAGASPQTVALSGTGT